MIAGPAAIRGAASREGANRTRGIPVAARHIDDAPAAAGLPAVSTPDCTRPL